MPSADTSAAATERVLWQSDLARRYGKDRTTMWRWQRNGLIPPPDIVIGGRCGWYESRLAQFERQSATGAPSAA